MPCAVRSDPILINLIDMKKSQLWVLWALVLVMGAAIGVTYLTQGAKAPVSACRLAGQNVFASFPANQVTEVVITGAAGKVTLSKKDGTWQVGEREGYPANVGQVNQMLRTLADVKITCAMEAGPRFAPRFGMDEEAKTPEARGLTLWFKDVSGNELAHVSLGKTMDGGSAGDAQDGLAVGRYIRNHADHTGFYAISEMFDSVTTDAARWLRPDFFVPEKIKSIDVTYQGQNQRAWKVIRDQETADFKLVDAKANEVLDANQGAALKNLLSYVQFDDVVTGAKLQEIEAKKDKRQIVIETFEGWRYEMVLTPGPEAAEVAGPLAGQQVLQVKVTGEVPMKRKVDDGETPEDAKIKDEAFIKRCDELRAKLKKEQALVGRSFLVNRSYLDSLMKERHDLLVKPQQVTPPSGGGLQGPLLGQ
jgi:hypothetical protein